MTLHEGRRCVLIAVIAAAILMVVTLATPLLTTPSQTATSSQSPSSTRDTGAAFQTAQEPALQVEHALDEAGASYEREVGVVLAKLPEGASASELSAQLAKQETLASPHVTPQDIEAGWATLPLRDGASVHDAISQLLESGLVLGAQPNYVYRLDQNSEQDALGTLSIGTWEGVYTPAVDDPQANSQWMLAATNADEAYRYAVLDEDGPHVSDVAADRASVAILDTGCYLDHEDLKDNIVSWYDAVNDVERARFSDVDIADPDDPYSEDGAHGTHVAGIVSARTNNGAGIAGTGGNAGLVPICVFKFDDEGELAADSRTLLRGMRYVIDKTDDYNIRVMNMSLGSDAEYFGIDSDDRAVLDAIDEASGKRILTVSSSCNDGAAGAYADFPTYCAETTIGVIAGQITSAKCDVGRSYYSNYNRPGVKVEQLTAPGDDILSTNDGHGDAEIDKRFHDGGEARAHARGGPDAHALRTHHGHF